MKHILNILFTFLTLVGFSQNYPIQTFFKGDSVVILTTEQYKDFELLLQNQRNRVTTYKNEISKKTKEVDSLRFELSNKNKEIDTLYSVVNKKILNYDTLKSEYDSVKKWLLNASIDNGFIYYSYSDSTIILIDLSSFVLVGNKRSGNFSLVRRGPTIEDEKWKKENRENPESPEQGWDLFFNKKYKPVLMKYPHKITL
jgi:hypothetical protein